MKPRKIAPFETPGAKPPAARPHGPSRTPGVAQPKTATTPRQKRQPVAPPAYRPQPVPRVLQAKSAAGPQPRTDAPPRRLAAPPAYRPQTTPRVLQKKDTRTQAAPHGAGARPTPHQAGARPVMKTDTQAPPPARSPGTAIQPKASGAQGAVIQAIWKKIPGLKKGQDYWESADDGDAPTGIYKQLGGNRWKNDENKQTYVKTGAGLNKQVQPSDPIEGKPQDYHANYEAALGRAMKVLLKHTKFGGSDTPRMYDKTYWKTGKDSDGDEILILKSGKPSDAVKAIFKSPKSWSFDCIEIIQVGRWFAEMTAMGEDEFDKKDKGVFKLSYHETTGLRGRQLYERERKRDQFMCVDGLTGRKTSTNVKLTTAQEEDAFLRGLPVGTRVMWSDAHDDAFDTDFENENTIKVGDDRYAAHPFGIRSAARIRSEMGPDYEQSKAKREAYIRRNVFIKQIEWNARS